MEDGWNGVRKAVGGSILDWMESWQSDGELDNLTTHRKASVYEDIFLGNIYRLPSCASLYIMETAVNPPAHLYTCKLEVKCACCQTVLCETPFLIASCLVFTAVRVQLKWVPSMALIAF